MNRSRYIYKTFIPADIVVIGFLALFTCVILVFNQQVSSPGWYVIKPGAIIGLYLILLELFKRYNTQWIAIPRHFYPVFLFPVIYRGFEPLIHIIVQQPLDLFFIRLDLALFGCNPVVWLERIINPLLTEILQVSYTTYYYFPTFLGIWLYTRGQYKDFLNVLLAITITLFGSFVFFTLVPVYGPRFFLVDLFTVPLEGKFFAPLVADFVGKNGLKGGAFPSAHSSVATLTLILSYRYFRVFFYISLPIMLCLYFSTIYCRYHYVSDILAGFILGALSAYLAPKWNDWWSKKRAETASSLPSS